MWGDILLCLLITFQFSWSDLWFAMKWLSNNQKVYKFYDPSLGLLLNSVGFIWISLCLTFSVVLVKNCILFVDTGLGVHSRKRTSMESLIFIYNIRNAIFRSKLGGLFIPRKSRERVRSFDTDICCLRAYCWLGFTSKGNSLLFSWIDPFTCTY